MLAARASAGYLVIRENNGGFDLNSLLLTRLNCTAVLIAYLPQTWVPTFRAVTPRKR